MNAKLGKPESEPRYDKSGGNGLMDVLVEVKKQPGKQPKQDAIPWADHVGDIAYKVIESTHTPYQ